MVGKRASASKTFNAAAVIALEAGAAVVSVVEEAAGADGND